MAGWLQDRPAAEAIAKCDIRLVEAMKPDEGVEKVAAHVRKHAPEVEFVPQGGMLPSKTPFLTIVSRRR